MDILYYSNNCKHCQSLLSYLAKNRLIDKYNFLNIDRRTVDPHTKQVHILLEKGTKALLPPNVTRVPALVLVNQKYRTVIGEEIYAYIEPTVTKQQDKALGFNGEPSGFVLPSSQGGVNIVSETYTMYDASPEELLAKGTGTMRQMHNYASATIELPNIPTPMDESATKKNTPDTQQSASRRAPAAPNTMAMIENGNFRALPNTRNSENRGFIEDSPSQEGVFYRAGQIVVPELQRPPIHRHEKIGEDVTIEFLQQKRNADLRNSIPEMARQLNNAVIPEIMDVNPPSSEFRSSSEGYFSNTTQTTASVQTSRQINYPAAYMPKLNPEDAREMLFGKRPDERVKSTTLSSPYLVNI